MPSGVSAPAHPATPTPPWYHCLRQLFQPVAKREQAALSALQQQLEPGEKILASTWGNIAPYGLFRGGILVASNRRVIRFSRQCFGQDFVSFAYSKIEMVLEESSFYGQRVVLSGQNGVLGFLPLARGAQKAKLRQVLDIIRKESCMSPDEDALAPEILSPADRLRELHRLHVEGIVTAEEYAERKNYLLGQL